MRCSFRVFVFVGFETSGFLDCGTSGCLTLGVQDFWILDFRLRVFGNWGIWDSVGPRDARASILDLGLSKSWSFGICQRLECEAFELLRSWALGLDVCFVATSLGLETSGFGVWEFSDFEMFV